MKINKKYAGIGSRSTPDEVLEVMTCCAGLLSRGEYTLRSGGAPKADTAFEIGATLKEIYLPWKGFNKNQSSLFTVSREAIELAGKYHPYWANCNRVVRLFHGRNCYQILGLTLDDPVAFVLCWTPEGSGNGGTGQALRIAKEYNIPIFDFGFGVDKTLKEFYDYLVIHEGENYGIA